MMGCETTWTNDGLLEAERWGPIRQVGDWGVGAEHLRATTEKHLVFMLRERESG